MSNKNFSPKDDLHRSSEKVRRLTFSALCLALCYVLPFITANNPSLGNMLCLMHIPVMLCGFLCGAPYGIAVGFVAPLLRTLTISAPPVMTAIPMAFELAVYGAVTGITYKALSKKQAVFSKGHGRTSVNVYISLVLAMLLGRSAGGAVKFVLLGLGYVESFSISAFVSAYLLATWPGIIIQIVFIPVVMLTLKRSGFMERGTF